MTSPPDLAVDRVHLREALTRAAGLVRAKGIVRCPTEVDGRPEAVLVQADDTTITIEVVDDDTVPTGLVLIGVDGVADLAGLLRRLTGT